MSIFLRGVDMPECCCGCPCCYEKADGSCFCTAVKDGEPCDIENLDQRLPNCPAEGVPEPHGRLIDADELMKVIEANDYTLRDFYNTTDRGMFTIGIKQAIDEASTIIETEE